jgi:hypothetical protein
MDYRQNIKKRMKTNKISTKERLVIHWRSGKILRNVENT